MMLTLRVRHLGVPKLHRRGRQRIAGALSLPLRYIAQSSTSGGADCWTLTIQGDYLWPNDHSPNSSGICAHLPITTRLLTRAVKWKKSNQPMNQVSKWAPFVSRMIFICPALLICPAFCSAARVEYCTVLYRLYFRALLSTLIPLRSFIHLCVSLTTWLYLKASSWTMRQVSCG